MKALIITDVQYDFLPGGALAVSHADEILPVIHRVMPLFKHVIATADWHPRHHVSFAETHHKKVGDVIIVNGLEQRLWPVHCVQNTHGSALAISTENIEAVFHKGSDPDIDSYSTFFDNKHLHSTGLGEYLKKHKLNDLYFVGLATDYCVLYSVLDALKLGFQVTVIRDGCRAIGDEKLALEKMQSAGARITTLTQLILQFRDV